MLHTHILAGCLGGQGKHKDALALLRQLAIARPNDPLVPIWVAEALLASGDFAGAATASESRAIEFSRHFR